MNFNELQRLIGNDLNPENLKKQESLYTKTELIRQEILPIFNFNTWTRKENPTEFTIILVFNKINALLVSLQNSILLNDGWLVMYIYRYTYELYIKTKYFFDKKENISERLQNFLDISQKENIKEKLEKISSSDNFISEIKNNHKDHYRMMNSIVHPNIESLNFHIVKDKNDNTRFLLMAETVVLTHRTISKILEIIIAEKDNILLKKCPNIQHIEKIISEH